MGTPDGAHTHGSGGGGWEAVAVLGLAAVVAVVVAPLLHFLLLAFAGFGLLAAAGLVLYVRYRWRHRSAIPSAWDTWPRVPPGRYVPQMQPPRQRYQAPPAPPREAIQPVQYHQHLHLGEMTPAERAETIRQLRGGQR